MNYSTPALKALGFAKGSAEGQPILAEDIFFGLVNTMGKKSLMAAAGFTAPLINGLIGDPEKDWDQLKTCDADFSVEGNRILTYAKQLARLWHDSQIGRHNLLAACLMVQSPLVSTLFERFGVAEEQLFIAIQRKIGGPIRSVDEMVAHLDDLRSSSGSHRALLAGQPLSILKSLKALPNSLLMRSSQPETVVEQSTQTVTVNPDMMALEFWQRTYFKTVEALIAGNTDNAKVAELAKSIADKGVEGFKAQVSQVRMSETPAGFGEGQEVIVTNPEVPRPDGYVPSPVIVTAMRFTPDGWEYQTDRNDSGWYPQSWLIPTAEAEPVTLTDTLPAEKVWEIDEENQMIGQLVYVLDSGMTEVQEDQEPTKVTSVRKRRHHEGNDIFQVEVVGGSGWVPLERIKLVGAVVS